MHHDFSVQPSCMETSEKMEFLAVGFADGSVETYFVNQNLKMTLICKINSSMVVSDLKCVSQHAILIQIQKNNICYSNIHEGNLTFNVSSFSSPITAVLWVDNNDLMFLGEQKGSLHIYQYQKEKNAFTLCITNALKDQEISCLQVSKSNQYLIVAFKEGSIEVYDMGTNFSAKPQFINIVKFEATFHFGSLNEFQTLIFSQDHGLISYVNLKTLEMYYCQWLHEDKLKSFKISEKQKIIFTAGLDKRVKIWAYFDEMNSSSFPKQRGIQYFGQEVKDFSIPTKEPLKKSFLEEKPMLQHTISHELAHAKQDDEEEEECQEEEEDLSNWG